jgi:hypothetical protein
MKSAVDVHNLHMTFIPHSWLFIAFETRTTRRVHFIHMISKLHAHCFPHSWLFIAFETRVTRRVPLVEQKLLTLSAYKDLYLWISCCSIFRFLFRSLFLLLYFFYLAIVLSVDLRFLITPLNLASSSFSQGHAHAMRSSQSTNFADFTNVFNIYIKIYQL